jgi:uncharacterized protein YjiK
MQEHSVCVEQIFLDKAGHGLEENLPREGVAVQDTG